MNESDRQQSIAAADQKLAQAFSVLDDTSTAALGDMMDWLESDETPADTPVEWTEFGKLCINIVMLMHKTR